MNQPLRLITLAVCCLTASAAAQNAAPVSDALRSTAQRDSRHLVAAAEEMPAGKYGFKPTPAQLSFGDVIAHLSGGNDYLCSTLAGVEALMRWQRGDKLVPPGDFMNTVRADGCVGVR